MRFFKVSRVLYHVQIWSTINEYKVEKIKILNQRCDLTRKPLHQYEVICEGETKIVLGVLLFQTKAKAIEFAIKRYQYDIKKIQDSLKEFKKSAKVLLK